MQLPFFCCLSAAAASTWLPGLDLFSLPALQTPHARALSTDGGRFYRQLARSPTGAFPQVHDAHTYVGATPSGLFVNFSSASITHSTTFNTDDYSSLLGAAALTCGPAELGGASLLLRLSFEGPLSPADEEGLSHLLERAAVPGAHVILGPATLRRHAAQFSGAGGCAPPPAAAGGAPAAPPAFSLALKEATPPYRLALRLTPAPPSAAFAYLSLSVAVGPAPPPPPPPLRGGGGGGAPRALSELKFASPAFDLGLNFDTAKGAAAAPKLQFFEGSPDSLFCEGCFFALRGAVVSVSLLVCNVARAGGVTYYLDATLPGDVASSKLGYYGGSGGACALGDGAGCKTGPAGGDAAARAATDCRAPPGGLGTGLGASLGDPAAPLDLGMRASVVVEGAAYLQFAVRAARGFAAATGFPTSCTGDVALCTRGPLPGLASPSPGPVFTITAGSLPIAVSASASLEAAFSISGGAPSLAWAMGVAGAAPTARFGGKVEMATSVGGGAPASAPLAAFQPALCPTAYTLSGLPGGGAGLALGAALSPRVRVSVGGLLTVEAFPAFAVKQTVAGSGAPLGGGGAAVCPAGRLPATATAGGTLGLAWQLAFLFPLSAALTGVAPPAGARDAPVLPFTLLLEPGTAAAAIPTAGAVATGPAVACVALDDTLSAAAGACAASAAARTWLQFAVDNRGVLGGGLAGCLAFCAIACCGVGALRRERARKAAAAAREALTRAEEEKGAAFATPAPAPGSGGKKRRNSRSPRPPLPGESPHVLAAAVENPLAGRTT